MKTTALRSLLVVLALMVLVPVAASAFPPQCDDVCNCQSKCTQACWIGLTRTTCGNSGDLCGCFAAAALTQSFTPATETKPTQPPCFEAAPQEQPAPAQAR
ncbi:MAG TPA: hypothetical protein VF173_24805 [Thermoanaerobaculia bacterium]|nr:hypothetical protein [Thermoanaerobaculia bacterium]